MNIDVRMECVFQMSIFLMEIWIVWIGVTRCHTKRLMSALVRVPVQNAMIVYVHYMNGHVGMDNVSKIDWDFRR
jgi:hypothetical protein